MKPMMFFFKFSWLTFKGSKAVIKSSLAFRGHFDTLPTPRLAEIDGEEGEWLDHWMRLSVEGKQIVVTSRGRTQRNTWTEIERWNTIRFESGSWRSMKIINSKTQAPARKRPEESGAAKLRDGNLCARPKRRITEPLSAGRKYTSIAK